MLHVKETGISSGRLGLWLMCAPLPFYPALRVLTVSFVPHTGFGVRADEESQKQEPSLHQMHQGLIITAVLVRSTLRIPSVLIQALI